MIYTPIANLLLYGWILFIWQQASSPTITSRANQARSAITGVQVTALNDSPWNCTVCNLVCNVFMATYMLSSKWCVINLYFQAMCLYWAVSAFFGVAQNIALKFPTVRRQLGIPKTPSESQQPIQELKILLQLKGEEFRRIQREGRTTKRDKWWHKNVPGWYVVCDFDLCYSILYNYGILW